MYTEGYKCNPVLWRNQRSIMFGLFTTLLYTKNKTVWCRHEVARSQRGMFSHAGKGRGLLQNTETTHNVCKSGYQLPATIKEMWVLGSQRIRPCGFQYHM